MNKFILTLLQASRLFRILLYSLFAGQKSYQRCSIGAMSVLELHGHRKLAFKRQSLCKSSYYSVFLLGRWLIFICMRSVRATCGDHHHILVLHQSQRYDPDLISSCSQHSRKADRNSGCASSPVRLSQFLILGQATFPKQSLNPNWQWAHAELNVGDFYWKEFIK